MSFVSKYCNVFHPDYFHLFGLITIENTMCLLILCLPGKGSRTLVEGLPRDSTSCILKTVLGKLDVERSKRSLL